MAPLRNPNECAIPALLNLSLVLGVLVLAVVLLKLGSQTDSLGWKLAMGVAFSYLLLTNYSLAHEAAHLKLFRNQTLNYWLGLIPATLFPMSLTLLINTHDRHHRQNRTDYELFDHYGPTDSRFLKTTVWYGILLGFFGLYPPIATLLLAVFPLKWIQKVFRGTNTTRSYASNFSPAEIRRIRGEFWGIPAFFVVLIYFFKIDPATLGLFYAFALINWSTRQFVEHAFTPLHIVEGSFNLKHNTVMSFCMLHRELDLSHHRHPEVPWLYLPRLVAREDETIGYLFQYIRMWKGPRPLIGGS